MVHCQGLITKISVSEKYIPPGLRQVIFKSPSIPKAYAGTSEVFNNSDLATKLVTKKMVAGQHGKQSARISTPTTSKLTNAMRLHKIARQRLTVLYLVEP